MQCRAHAFRFRSGAAYSTAVKLWNLAPLEKALLIYPTPISFGHVAREFLSLVGGRTQRDICLAGGWTIRVGLHTPRSFPFPDFVAALHLVLFLPLRCAL